MQRIELGQFWLARFGQKLPNTSIRLRTKLAWHLAALSVRSDEELKSLPDDKLTIPTNGSARLIEIRTQYLRALERSQPARHSPSPIA